MSLAARRVNKGAQLLDQKAPGWWEVVDPITLDLGTYAHCVLGQIAARQYPHTPMNQSWFQLTERDLGIGLVASLTHGFDAIRRRKIPRLEHHWRNAIATRRRAAFTVMRNTAPTAPQREEVHV